MKEAATLTVKHVELLTHMLGAGFHVKKRHHGYRNHFCAQVADATMLEMQAAGLVVPGVKINDGRDQYFHATREGCRVAGLGKAATNRAMEGREPATISPEKETSHASGPGLLELEAAALAKRGWDGEISQVDVAVPESGFICGGDWPNVSNEKIVQLCRDGRTTGGSHA